MIFKIRRFSLDKWYICKEKDRVGNYVSVDYLHRDLTLQNCCGDPNFYELKEAKNLLNKWCEINGKTILKDMNTEKRGFYMYEIGEDFISTEDIEL